MSRKALKQVAVGLGTICAGIAAIASSSTGLINANRNKIDEFLGTVSSKYVNDEVPAGTDLYNYRPEKSITVDGKTFDCTTAQGMYDYSVNVSERLAAEGQALLKNKAGVLPLAKNSPVTMLGFRSYKSIFGGDMGSVPVYSEATNFSVAMKQQGFSVNQDVESKYEQAWAAVGYKETTSKGTTTIHEWTEAEAGGNFANVGAGFGAVTTPQGFNFYEPSSADLGLVAQAKSGVAIVTVGRPAREAGYFLPGADGKKEADPKHNSTWGEDVDCLGLCDQERDIIRFAKNNYEKVIVVVNTSSAMDIPELFEANGELEADAVLWAGLPGAYGFKQTAKILDGTINPSGGLSDIYEAKSSATATGVNVGYFQFADDDATSDLRTGSEKSAWYEAETEGIYSGYKYDETRYFDLLKNPSFNAGTVHSGSQRDTAKLGATSWKYEENVVRSFGYGLSYTTFSEKITNIQVNDVDRVFTATVEVENKGTVAGKDNVQLYVSLPYETGMVQKSAIQLAGFGKTKLLNAGAKETLTITVRFQDIASWDANFSHDNVKGGYVLDKGDYYFAVGNGAHSAVNNVLGKMGVASNLLITEDGLADNEVANDMAYKVTFADKIEITKSLNGTTLKNQLEDMDPSKAWNLTMLDRSHWDTTFPQKNLNLRSTAAMAAGLRCNNYTLKENNNGGVEVVWGKKTDVTWLSAKPAKGTYIDYDAQAITELVQAITLEDALFVAQSAGGMGVDEIKSINAPEYVCNDGPAGFDSNAGRNLLSDNANPTNTEYTTSAETAPGNIPMRPLPDEVLIGGTFNHELVKEAGEMIGQVAIWVGCSGIYGPGSNIHRTPYNTRNHEYYSEDPIVLGQFTDDYCVGGLKYGLNMYPKHYAFNDYDLNRSGIAPFLGEQDARENALRGFQFAFETNHARGAMGAFGRAGAVFCNAHVGLQTGIAREEWGWTGYMVTDMVNPAYYMNFVDTIWGGADGMLTTANAATYETNNNHWINPENAEQVALVKKDMAFQAKLQETMRHLLWAELNSNLMNGKAGAGHTVYYTTWYDALITGLSVGGFVIAGLAAVGFLALTFVPKKKDN